MQGERKQTPCSVFYIQQVINIPMNQILKYSHLLLDHLVDTSKLRQTASNDQFKVISCMTQQYYLSRLAQRNLQFIKIQQYYTRFMQTLSQNNTGNKAPYLLDNNENPDKHCITVELQFLKRAIRTPHAGNLSKRSYQNKQNLKYIN